VLTLSSCWFRLFLLWECNATSVLSSFQRLWSTHRVITGTYVTWQNLYIQNCLSVCLTSSKSTLTNDDDHHDKDEMRLEIVRRISDQLTDTTTSDARANPIKFVFSFASSMLLRVEWANRDCMSEPNLVSHRPPSYYIILWSFSLFL